MHLIYDSYKHNNEQEGFKVTNTLSEKHQYVNFDKALETFKKSSKEIEEAMIEYQRLQDEEHKIAQKRKLILKNLKQQFKIYEEELYKQFPEWLV